MRIHSIMFAFALTGALACEKEIVREVLVTQDPDCGNGVVEEGEASDEGVLNGRPNHCDWMCNAVTLSDCGNGYIEKGEACDDGIFNGQPGRCDQACEGPTPPRCGDGMLDAGEECDDGNNQIRDGCSAACIDERDACKLQKVGHVNGEGILSARMAPGKLAVLSNGQDYAGFYTSIFDVTQPAIPIPGPIWGGPSWQSGQVVWAIEVEDRTIYRFEDGAIRYGSIDWGAFSAQWSFQIWTEYDCEQKIYNYPDQTRMRVMDKRVYIATPDCGFDIVFFYPWDEPGVINVHPGPINDLAVYNGRAYLAAGSEGMLVYDIRDYEAPVLEGRLDTTPNFPAYRIQVSDGKAYLYNGYNNGGTMRIIDVTNPSTPVLLYEHPMEEDGLMRVFGNYAYLLTEHGGLIVVDISDPSEPNFDNSFEGQGRIIERYGEAGGVLDVQISGEYLLLTYEDHVSILTGLPGVCQPVCGNSTKEYPEACDDGNLTGGDGCNATCTGP